MIKLSLLIYFVALALLMMAKVANYLNLLFLEKLTLLLGGLLIICALIILSLTGFFKSLSHIIINLRYFFSPHQRMLRRVWFLQTKIQHLDGVFIHKKRQLNYVSSLKYQCLVKKDNRRQVLLLSKQLENQLIEKKELLPKSHFENYRQQIKTYTHEQDIAGLVVLNQQLFTRFKAQCLS